MALSDYLKGDIFRGVTETGGVGSKALYDAYLGRNFADWGGMFSPQARTLGNYFQPIWSNYLGEILAASPASGLQGLPKMPGRSATAPATDFVDYLRNTNFEQMYGALPPSARGVSGSRFNPIVKRVR